VDDLKAKLAAQEVVLKQKNDAADALIEIVGVETEKVSQEKKIGSEMLTLKIKRSKCDFNCSRR
jgi:dynein heavy chain, axonemal